MIDSLFREIQRDNTGSVKDLYKVAQEKKEC